MHGTPVRYVTVPDQGKEKSVAADTLVVTAFCIVHCLVVDCCC